MKTFVLSNGDLQLGDWEFRIDPDATIIVYMNTHRRNFKCSYCCGGNTGKPGDCLNDIFGINKVVDAFRFLQEQTERKLYIWFSGGEPSIINNWGEFIAKLTEFVSVGLETNLCTSGTTEFAKMVNPERVGHICAAYHFETLDRNAQFEKLYVENFHLLIQAGFAPACKVIAVPWELSPLTKFEDRLAKIRTKLPERIIFASPFIGLWNGKTYPFAYTPEQQKFLNEIMTVRKTEQLNYIRGAQKMAGMLCDAGCGITYLSREGFLYRCWADGRNGKPLGNLMERNIRLKDSLEPCPYENCGCPLWGLWEGFKPWKYFINGVPGDYNRFSASRIIGKKAK